jgi:hypothetical protein
MQTSWIMVIFGSTFDSAGWSEWTSIHQPAMLETGNTFSLYCCHVPNYSD